MLFTLLFDIFSSFYPFLFKEISTNFLVAFFFLFSFISPPIYITFALIFLYRVFFFYFYFYSLYPFAFNVSPPLLLAIDLLL